MVNKREYEKTHPWISFRLDLTRAPGPMWLWLGQASALCWSLGATPVSPETRNKMHRLWLAKGVSATTAIEGNTLTEEQVRAQIDGELEVPQSHAYLQTEVQNILDACNEILEQVRAGQVPELSVDLIKNFNHRVLNGLEEFLEDGVVPGEISERNVVVAKYRGAPRRDCEYLLQRLVDWLNDDIPDNWPGIQGGEIVMALIKSAVAHLYIAWIHPFGDGNGRTARLIEFLLLMRAGVPSPAAHLLSNHYNETRLRYYQELKDASGTGGDVFPFLQYAFEGFVGGLIRQMGDVQGEHMQLVWQSYVHERIEGERATVTWKRRRAIARALAGTSRPVSKREISELTPAIAKMYGDKSAKAVARDLSKLVQLGLLRRDGKGYRASTEKLLEFLPVVNDQAAVQLKRSLDKRGTS
jgi:Fic family protein